MSLFLVLCALGAPLALAANGPDCQFSDLVENSTVKSFPRTRRVIGFTWDHLTTVHQFLEAQPRVWDHVLRESSWEMKPYRLFQDWIHPVLRFLAPVWLPRAHTPTFSLFKSLWKNREYTPTEAEKALLDRYGARQQFEDKKAFMARHPYWTALRRGVDGTLEGARVGTIILAVNLLYHQMAGGTPTVDEYLKLPQYALATTQVRLLNDLVPFPHTAIQIGDRVYSYGQTHMSRQTVNEYLRYREIQKMLEAERIRMGEPEPPAPVDPSRGSSAALRRVGGRSTDGLVWALGLDKLPQSLQVVTLNLTQAEADKLQRYLEFQVGKKYANTTMVNDCATMVLRALAENTSLQVSRLIDASPSQISFYFAGLKTLGSKSVGPIYQVTTERPDYPHLARNYWVNVVESRLFIDLLFFNQVNRLYIDAVYSPATLQIHDEGVLRAIEEFRQDFAETVKADPQVQLWQEFKIPTLRDRAKQGMAVEEQARELVSALSDYFDERVAEADAFLLVPSLDILDRHRYEVRRQLYESKRIELLLEVAKIKGPLP